MEWKEYKYTDLCTLIGGGTPKTSESSYWGGDIPWLSVKDFGNDGKYVYSTEKTITETGLNNSSTKLLKKDDIIISARGTIGAIAMLSSEMAFNQSCFGIRSNELVDQHYLYYLTKTKIAELQKNSHGSVFDTITRETFAKLDCQIPPIELQKVIASILSALDDKIEVNRRINDNFYYAFFEVMLIWLLTSLRNDNLEQQAQALFKSWFVDFEPFRDQPFVESELGMIPQGWRVIQLIDIAEISKNSINPQKHPQTIFNHYSIPAFDEGMKPEIQLGEEIKSNKFVITNKITLFSKLNPRIKRVWYVDKLKSNSICSTEFVPYKAKDESQSSFLYSLINSQGFYDYVMSMVNGATGSHQRFHPEESLNYRIAFNYECVSKYCEVMSPIIHQMLDNREESRRLAQLRDTLLPRLMSGELSVDGLKGQFAVSPGQRPGSKEHESNNTAL